jgi:hypothetical protein
MLDPLILKTVSAGFGLLFLLAAVHKISAAEQFRIVLQEYQLLPEAAVAPVARIVPLIEILLGAGWLFSYQLATIAVVSASLLGAYTIAIAINLSRGRVHIGCGCGFAGTDDNEQQLSFGLVIRNIVLITAALVGAVPAADRTLGMVDYATLIVAVLAGVLLYVASNQLLTNHAAIGAWRNNHD